jgi:hypothetical protein
VFVNHLCGAKGEQDGKADEGQESFAEFVIPGSDSPVAFDSLEEVFYPITTPVRAGAPAAAIPRRESLMLREQLDWSSTPQKSMSCCRLSLDCTGVLTNGKES